jgi:hypothetical protein
MNIAGGSPRAAVGSCAPSGAPGGRKCSRVPILGVVNCCCVRVTAGCISVTVAASKAHEPNEATMRITSVCGRGSCANRRMSSAVCVRLKVASRSRLIAITSSRSVLCRIRCVSIRTTWHPSVHAAMGRPIERRGHDRQSVDDDMQPVADDLQPVDDNTPSVAYVRAHMPGHMKMLTRISSMSLMTQKCPTLAKSNSVEFGWQVVWAEKRESNPGGAM